MMEHILASSSESPEELKKRLDLLTDEECQKYRFVNLAISGDNVVVRPFELENVRIRDLKNRLQLESVELMNLPADQIIFDFQILEASTAKIRGVYACVPKSLIENYVKVIKKAKLSALAISPYILSIVNAFLLQTQVPEERYCVLDFSSEDCINLAVLNNQKFELLRKIPFEGASEAKMEIIRTLRSACAQSAVKHFDHICFSGTVPNKDELMSEVGIIFQTKVIYKNYFNVNGALSADRNYFSINLVRNVTVSLPQRKKLLTGTHVFLLLTCVTLATLGWKIHTKQRQITSLVPERPQFIESLAVDENIKSANFKLDLVEDAESIASR